jgi:hypothetical protein
MRPTFKACAQPATQQDESPSCDRDDLAGGVRRASLDSTFGSKDQLIRAYLQERSVSCQALLAEALPTRVGRTVAATASAFASVNHEALTLEKAELVLADIVAVSRPQEITPRAILEATAATFGFSVEDCAAPAAGGHTTVRPLDSRHSGHLLDHAKKLFSFLIYH